jgi:hypothetical protein
MMNVSYSIIKVKEDIASKFGKYLPNALTHYQFAQ